MLKKNKSLLIVMLTLLLSLAFLMPQTVLAEKIVLHGQGHGLVAGGGNQDHQGRDNL